MNTDLLNYGHAPKSDQTVTDIYGDEWHPNLVTTPSSSQPHSIISSGSNAFSQCNHVANIQYQMAAHSPISMCSRAPTPSWTGSPFTTQPVYDLDASHQFDVPWPVREPDDHRPLLSRLENAVEPATPKSISPRGAVWEYVESEADGVFPLFAQDSSKFEVDQFTKTIPTLNSEDAHPLRGRLARERMVMAQCIRSWSKAGIYKPSLPLFDLSDDEWVGVLASLKNGSDP